MLSSSSIIMTIMMEENLHNCQSAKGFVNPLHCFFRRSSYESRCVFDTLCSIHLFFWNVLKLKEIELMIELKRRRKLFGSCEL